MKKRLILFGLVCCWILQANAQTNNNTIVNTNSSWATLIYGLGAYNIPCCAGTQYVYFDGDSTVSGHLYKKVFSCDDQLHENVKYEGLIREQNKKTYFTPADSVTEYLLYDFLLEESQTFEYWDFRTAESMLLYVKSVDFVTINGSMKKRIQITADLNSDWIIDTWIEEIGSLSGILYPCYRIFIDGGVRSLLCYYQNNELGYKNPVYSKCYYDNADDIVSVQTIMINDCSIYPNPIDEVLTVFSSNNTVSWIEIFDIYGKKVYSQPYNSTVNLSPFSKGLYLLKVYNTNKQFAVFKIIKK